MRQLTQEEAERCYRAAGYWLKEYPDGVEVYEGGGWKSKDVRCWMTPGGKPLTSESHLPADPHYIFAKLWDRWDEITKDKNDIRLTRRNMPTGSVYNAEIMFAPGPFGNELDHPCLTLCMAIEALVEIEQEEK